MEVTLQLIEKRLTTSYANIYCLEHNLDLQCRLVARKATKSHAIFRTDTK